MKLKNNIVKSAIVSVLALTAVGTLTIPANAAAAKEKMLSYFFGNTSVEDFNEMCHRFIDKRLPSLIRTKALDKIKETIEILKDEYALK